MKPLISVCRIPLLLSIGLFLSGVAVSHAVEPTAPADAAKTLAPAPVDDASASATAAFDHFVGEKILQGPSHLKKIAMTFDDGPHPKYTPQVLAALKEAGIHATFNMVGEMVRDYPDTARAVAEAGQEIGSHSFTHPNLSKQDAAAVRNEVVSAIDEIEKVTGRRTRLFRPPGGFITATLRQVCRDAGLVIVMWSVDPRDWTREATPESIIATTLKQIHGGAIICLHDTHPKTAEALPRLIAALKEQGYTFTTVGDLIQEADRAAREAPQAGSAGGSSGSGSSGGGGGAAPPPPPVISLDQSSLPK